MEKKVLLTGFDPFGGETVNPSWEAVKRLNGAAERRLYRIRTSADRFL